MIYLHKALTPGDYNITRNVFTIQIYYVGYTEKMSLDIISRRVSSLQCHRLIFSFDIKIKMSRFIISLHRLQKENKNMYLLRFRGALLI